MNKKILSFTIAAAMTASLMQTAVFAASPTRAEALRTVIQTIGKESYNKDGGNCTVVNLPDVGITGNSHFMFQEKNSEEIASHIENWIKENVK